MDLMSATGSKDHQTSILANLADGRRRRIIDVLLGSSPSLTVEELAANLAETERMETPGRDTLLTDLVHTHLPALEDADLVAWDRDAGTVTTTDCPVLEDPKLQRIVGQQSDGWDDVVDCLANERRRTALAVLEERSGPTSRRTLAREVAEREGDGEPSRDAVEETLVTLHHVHLPKLVDAGIVEYDGDEMTVASRSDLELEATEFDTQSGGTPYAFPSETEHYCDD